MTSNVDCTAECVENITIPDCGPLKMVREEINDVQSFCRGLATLLKALSVGPSVRRYIRPSVSRLVGECVGPLITLKLENAYV